MPLSHQQFVELKQTVDPLERYDDLGVSLYVAARKFVRACFFNVIIIFNFHHLLALR